MPNVQIVISAVTNEFGSYRKALHDALDRPNVSVKIQEHFVDYPDTLDKVDDYIRHSDAVIHILGATSGHPADASCVDYMGRKHPGLGEAVPELAAALAGQEVLSYTQWEAWLAIFHNKELIVAEPAADAKPDTPCVPDAQQQAHRVRLLKHYRHPVPFATPDQLALNVLRSKLHDLLHPAKGKKPPNSPRRERGQKPMNLPYHSLGSLFKGRTAFMKQLRDSLAKTTAQPHASAITGKALHGLGGIGKTRLAVEYAWQHIADYSALLCVIAESPGALRTNLAALCGPLVLNLPEQKMPEEEARLAAALHWLEAHPGWFLILDNVDTPETAREVEALLADLHGGHVIITSRISHWNRQVERLELDVLTVEDAVDYLLEYTDGSRRKTLDDAAIARAIATNLGQLALALEQAGAYISVHRRTLAQYADAWRRSHDKLIAWADAQQMQYPKSVAITWLTSFEQLGPAARRLMNRLAWLSPEPIPESLIDEPVPGDEGGDSAAEALAELERYSLVSRSPDADAPVFTVHRLVQDVAFRMMDEATRQQSLAAALGRVDAAFKDDPGDVRSWPVLDPLAPHALKLAQDADANNLAVGVSRLLNQLGVLSMSKAQYNIAEPLMRRALQIDEQSFGKDHPKVAIRLNNLALLLQDTNRLEEAEPLMRRALKIDEQSFGKDHPEVATDLNSLATLLQATNRLEEAEPLMRRALQIDEQSFGKDHPRVAVQLNNLATLLQATNRLEEAEPLMRQALQINEQSFGKDHPTVAIRLNNLARLLQDTNRFEEAEPLMRRALQIDEKSFGIDHPTVAIRLNNLASLLQATNRLEEAEPLMRRALQIDEQSFGKDHPKVGIRLSNLALLLQVTNRLAEAEPLMRRHLSIFISFTKKNGHEHPHLRAAINNYGELLMEMGHSHEEAQGMIDALFNTP